MWADLGSGTGAFTLALAELLGSTGVIHSIDRDAGALRTQAEALRHGFPSTVLHQYATDFTVPIDVPALDGVVMANSLHFVRDKGPVLALVCAMLRPAGRLVLVEYDADHGNPWVPYPVSSRAWPAVAAASGFTGTRELARVPSRFLGAIYAACSIRPAAGPLADGTSNEGAVPSP